MAKLKRTKLLAEAVAASFEAAGFSPSDLLQGQIRITDLPWQAPPLLCEAPLGGVPLHEHLAYPLGADAEELYRFYLDTLAGLKTDPENIATPEGYKGLARVLPRATAGERNLALPVPDGWPAGTYSTGAMFAMEVARLFFTSTIHCSAFVSNANDYYATTPWGDVGVKAGLPTACQDLWDLPCLGHVQGMLELPRGLLSTNCSYDIVARLRSALHESPEAFAEFEGVDYALQALRILAGSGLSQELKTAVERMSLTAFKRKARIKAFEEAVSVMQSWHLTDRAKVSMLMEILVPTHFTLPEFSRKVLNPLKVLPAVLANKTERRILATLKHELEKAEHAHRTPKA